MTLPRRLVLSMATALVAVMMTATPAMAAQEPFKKCLKAQENYQEAFASGDAKKEAKYLAELYEHCDIQ
jgi:glucose-6-phosphate isomerase